MNTLCITTTIYRQEKKKEFLLEAFPISRGPSLLYALGCSCSLELHFQPNRLYVIMLSYLSLGNYLPLF